MEDESVNNTELKTQEQINQATKTVLADEEAAKVPPKPEEKKDNYVILSIRQNLDNGKIDCILPDNIQHTTLLHAILTININQLLYGMLNPVNNKSKLIIPGRDNIKNKISNLMKRRIF